MNLTLLLLACSPEADLPKEAPLAVGVLAEGPLNPFPSLAAMADGRVAIPPEALPRKEDGTHMDVVRLNWSAGFSPVQPAIVRLHVALDAASLNGQDAAGYGGAVRMYDLDSGAEVPCFAELDAHPDTRDVPAERTLIVRPSRAMTPGHEIAVVVTSAVRTAEGVPLSVPAWAEAQERDPAFAGLSERLGALGVDDIALAWSFPVGDGRPLLRALTEAAPVPSAFRFTRVRDADEEEPGRMPPGAWKILEGSYTVPNWLAEERGFEVDASGLPELQGETDAYLMVLVPDALRDAPAGEAPVIVFGHGILGEPSDYLASGDDGAGVIGLANRLGAVVVATKWRGLTEDDQPEALAVAMDFGRFPELTDKLAQGVANTVGLVRLAHEGGLADEPALAGKVKRGDVRYYGISLGGIEGAVTLANAPQVELGAFHVAGSAWGTMLERSSNWPPFEMLVVRGIENPADRQLLYAASQLLWDPVDPASWTEELATRNLLWQEAMEDNQVPNLTTELLARSVGAQLGTPSVTQPFDLVPVALPAAGPVVTQFDPMTERLERANRPASNTNAHGIPRAWPGCRAQVETFLREGEVRHYCGEAPCTAENTGE